MPSAFSVLAILVRPHPSAQSWNIRRTTAACASLIVVAVNPAAGHVERLRLPEHGVVRALPGLLPLHLRGEVGQREHDLVHGAVERALAIIEVEEDPHAKSRTSPAGAS